MDGKKQLLAFFKEKKTASNAGGEQTGVKGLRRSEITG